jgi:hypothetical protein
VWPFDQPPMSDVAGTDWVGFSRQGMRLCVGVI